MIAARKNALLTVVLAFVAMIALLAGCSSGSLSAETTVTSTAGGTESGSSTESASSGSSSSSSAAPSTTKVVPPVASIAATPALGAVDLSPVEPISFTVDKGTIDDVTLTNPEGKVVVATIAPDRKSWSVGEVLGFGKTYTLAGTATGTDGKQIPITGTYTTVSTDTQTRNTVNPADGAVVGVAAPISVSFGVEPEDRALIEKNVSITTTPAVEGAWAWVKHDDGRWAMDYRTKDYWPAGTVVHVDAKLYGLRFNATSYGASDITSDFTIGRNQVVIADVNSHDLIVQQNGQTVASYPASFGRGSENGDPELVTRSGVHVVTEKAEEYLMNNPRYGYTNSLQRWTVRISNNGEFIHANPDSAGAQGNSNVTHGCVNLSTADAQAYYNSAIWGDPVEVSGTNVNLSSMDGDIYIWGMTWDEWKAMSTTP
ncbi:MAG: Ig-like domain-containing protein [Nakamurella sp.]